MSKDIDLPLSWKLRKALWNGFLGLKYKGAKPAYIPIPVQQDRKIKPIPIGDYYDSLKIDNVLVADHVPDDEAQPIKRLAVSFQIWLSNHYPQMQAGLPPVASDPQAKLNEAYSGKRSKLFPPPEIPETLKMKDSATMLGRLAVEGPFAGYLKKDGSGFTWDLTYLNNPEFELLGGTEKVGTLVEFQLDTDTRSLRAKAIQTATGKFVPDDDGWSDAVRLALCGLTNDISIVRHFNWVHLIGGSFFAIATRNQLGANHPLRRLLWPHVFRTQYSNDMITQLQLGPAGDFANMMTFSARGVSALLAASHGNFTIETAHPVLDAARRGIAGSGLDTPSQDNQQALFDIFLRHTQRYIDAYYPDDSTLEADVDVIGWLEETDRLLPNGTSAIVNGKPPKQAVAELCASLIYLGTVKHEVLGTNLWNYQLWTHIIPCRVYKDGQREPVDVYQRLLNANLNLNIYRAQLMRDFAYLAVDGTGRELFKTFHQELRELNDEMRDTPHALWKIYPDMLEANMNA